MIKLSQVLKHMTKLALNQKELQDLIGFRKLDDISTDPSLIPSNKPLMVNPTQMDAAIRSNSELGNQVSDRVAQIYSSGFRDHDVFKNKIAPRLIAQEKDPNKVLDAVNYLVGHEFKKHYVPDEMTDKGKPSDFTAGNVSLTVNHLRSLLRRNGGIEIQEGRPGADLELYKDLDTVMQDVQKKSPFMHVGDAFRIPEEFKRMGQNTILNSHSPMVASYRPNIENIFKSSDNINSTMDMFTNVNKLHEFSESQSRELGADELSGERLLNYIVKNPGSLYSTLSNTGGHKGQQPIEDLALLANLTGPGSEAARKSMAQLRREDIAGMQAILGLTKKNKLRTQLLLNHATLDPNLLDQNTLTNESATINNVLGKYFSNDISSNKQFNEKLKQLAISKGLIGAEGSLSDITEGSTLANSIKAKIKPETLKGIVQSLGPTRMSSEARNILYKNLDLSAASPEMQGTNLAGVPDVFKSQLIKNNEDENVPYGGNIGSAFGLLVPQEDNRVGNVKNYISYMPIATPSPDVSKGQVITNAIKDSLKAAPLEPLKRSISKL